MQQHHKHACHPKYVKVCVLGLPNIEVIELLLQCLHTPYAIAKLRTDYKLPKYLYF